MDSHFDTFGNVFVACDMRALLYLFSIYLFHDLAVMLG